MKTMQRIMLDIMEIEFRIDWFEKIVKQEQLHTQF